MVNTLNGTASLTGFTICTLVTPGISITSSATTVCSGSSVSFTATSSNGGSSPAYQWKKNGNNVGSNAANYSDATLVNGDVMSCVLTANNVCQTVASANSNTIGVTIINSVIPAVNIVASKNSICGGTTVTFTATPVNGGNKPYYQWYLNAIPVANDTTATYSNGTMNNNDSVKCFMTSSAICPATSMVASNKITENVILSLIHI